ncbi:MAG: hypothetical protein ACQERD_05640 [Campylobacterota bacterium]
MGLFDIKLQKKITLKSSKDEFINTINNKLQQERSYEYQKESSSLSIDKLHLDTLLKYNFKLNIEKKQGHYFLNIDAILHDTLILTILIILAILLTYGIGVIFVVGFAYLQKRKATRYLETIIDKIEY